MKRGIAVATAVIVVFLAAPMAIVLVSSFDGGKLLSFPPKHLSLKPYGDLFGSSELMGGLLRSLLVGAGSAVICLILALPACVAVWEMSPRARAAVNTFLTLGFAVPVLVSAVAFLLLYYEFGAFGTLWSLGLALAAINLPFFLYAVASSVRGRDPNLGDAARTLGADDVQTFLFITLPALAPGIMTGMLLVFVAGITEFLASAILTNVHTTTLPVMIFGSLRSGATPMLAAAGGIYVLITVAVLVVVTRVRGLDQFLHRDD